MNIMKNKRPGRRRPPGPKARDLGLEVEAGKGDAPRSCFSPEFREHLDEALSNPNNKPAEGFVNVGAGRQVKVYR